MTYDFSSLSPDDFEDLICDLLSREWGVRLEKFKPGKDQGIDLRHSARPANDEVTIVQCKRYGPQKYRALLADLTAEIPKIEKMSPSRYVVATSVPLSPGQKDEIAALLRPWCTTVGDVYGADDINALIRSHPAVERSHFKLWISSTTVMERMLHARIFEVSDDTMETLRLQLSRLVVHGGFNRALDILASDHHAVIVGNPGIGKSTLARMLLCHYTAEGFEPITVVGDIEDAWSLLHAATKDDRKLAIFYDDFLGRVRFDAEKFAKNEESSLLRLIDRVRRNDNLRFILTTREYILSDAQRLHGAFAERAQDLALCTITLDDYTRTGRAQMLFNHLYFSDLPDSKIEQLVGAKVYDKIVAHRHFNPRVVETVCRNANSRTLSDGDFVKYVEHEFDNPAKIWRIPFVNDISATSRFIVGLLWTYRRNATLEDLRSAVIGLHDMRISGEHSLQFDEAIRQIDGNFISTTKYPDPSNKNGTVVASFNNPSVEEFIAEWLAHEPEFIRQLIGSISNLEQADKIALGIRECDCADSFKAHLRRQLLARSIECQGAHAGTLQNHAFGKSRPKLTWIEKQVVPARELHIILSIEQDIPEYDERRSPLKDRVCTIDGWLIFFKSAQYDYRVSRSINSLWQWIQNESKWSAELTERVKNAYLGALLKFIRDEDIRVMSISNFENLISAFGSIDTLDMTSKETLVEAIRSSVSDAIDNADDSDWLDSEASHLESIEIMLGVDFGSENDRLKQAAAGLSDRERDSSVEAPEKRRYSSESEAILDLDSFFADLLNR